MDPGPLGHVRTVLVRPQQPGNIGAAARAIANHGLGELVLVAPQGYDPERARWMAPGATAIVDGARFSATVAEAVADAALVVGTTGRVRRWRWPVLDPSALASAVLEASGPVAILYGQEDKGLSNEDLELCHALLALPTATHASLNLGQAVTVTCAGLLQAAVSAGATLPATARRRLSASEVQVPLPAARPGAAPAARQAELAGLAVELLRQTSYLAGRPEEQVRGSLYRLLARAGPDDDELGFLTGMLKALDWQLRRRPGDPSAPSGSGS